MQLRNPLTRAALEKLRPLPIVVDFTHTDFPGPLLIGMVPAGHIVRETVIDVQEEFDGGVTMTVGDMVAQARLQVTSDNRPTAVHHYNVNNVYEYATDTDVYVFFPSGTPTTGSAKITVFLD